MSRQLGSLHRSNSHPNQSYLSNPNNTTFCFSATDFPSSNVTSGMNSDTNSHISVLYSISQLNNPNIETPDEFADSEPSPSNNFHNSSNFSQPPFNPYYPITLTQSLPHPLMLPKLPQPTPHTILTNHLILQTPPESPQS